MAQKLSDIIDQLRQHTDGQERVAVGDVLDAFANRLFGPLLLVPGLFALSPLGAIPTVPTMCGLLILLIAVQQLVGFKHPWVPAWLDERSVEGDKMAGALDRMQPWARRVDRLIKPRLKVLVEGPMQYVLAVAACLLAAMMPPLELVPLAVFVPAAGVVALGLSMTAHDGALALTGLLLAVTTIGLALWAIL